MLISMILFLNSNICNVISFTVHVTCKEGFIHDFVWFEIFPHFKDAHALQLTKEEN